MGCFETSQDKGGSQGLILALPPSYYPPLGLSFDLSIFVTSLSVPPLLRFNGCIWDRSYPPDYVTVTIAVNTSGADDEES